MSDKLNALLARPDSYNVMPVIGPNSAAEIQAWRDAMRAEIDQLETATESDIDRHITALSLATKEKPVSPQEAKARLELYCRVLRKTLKVDLARGVDKLLREAKFMPTPAEVFGAASLFAARRNLKLAQADKLLLKHRLEWKPPLRDEDLVKPEEVKALSASIAEQFPTERGDQP